MPTGPDPATLNVIVINPDAKASVPAHNIRWNDDASESEAAHA